MQLSNKQTKTHLKKLNLSIFRKNRLIGPIIQWMRFISSKNKKN